MISTIYYSIQFTAYHDNKPQAFCKATANDEIKIKMLVSAQSLEKDSVIRSLR